MFVGINIIDVRFRVEYVVWILGFLIVCYVYYLCGWWVSNGCFNIKVLI